MRLKTLKSLKIKWHKSCQHSGVKESWGIFLLIPQALNCPLPCLNPWTTIQKPGLKLLSFAVLIPFLHGRPKKLLWNMGQREEFDLYVNYSSGRVLGDRDPGSNFYDVLFSHFFYIFSETQNHRIRESLKLEKTSKITESNLWPNASMSTGPQH